MLNITSSCPSQTINRISGPSAFGLWEFTFGGTDYTLQLVGDFHGSIEGSCYPCNDKKCKYISSFIEDQLKCSDIPTHFYLEMPFIYANEYVEDETNEFDPKRDFMGDIIFNLGKSARKKSYPNALVHYTDLRMFGSLNLLQVAEGYVSDHRKFDSTLYDKNITPMKKALKLDFSSWEKAVDNIFEVYVYSNNFLKDFQKNMPNIFKIMPHLHFQGNNWWVEETSFMGGFGRVPILRKEILKLNTKAQELIIEYAELLQEKIKSMKFYKKESDIIQIIIEDFRVEPAEIINVYIGSALIEIYTLARMFRTFDIDENEKRKNVIFYFGNAHILHFNTWFLPLLKEYTHVNEKQKFSKAKEGGQKRCAHIKKNISIDLL